MRPWLGDGRFAELPCGNGIIQVGGPYGDSISINMTSINNMVCQALILSFANDGGAWNPLCGGPPTLLVGDGTNCVVALAKLAIQTTTGIWSIGPNDPHRRQAARAPEIIS